MDKVIDIPQIECKICGRPMPLIRLTKFGYNFCVNCSNVDIKRGIPVTRGTGEDTWIDLEIVEHTGKPTDQCIDYNLYFEDEE